MKSILTLVMFISTATIAQYSIPFASTNNAIELAIANSSSVAASNIVVTLTAAPQWLRIGNRTLNIENLKTKETQIAAFTFSIDKSAPVNKPEQLTFTITNSRGEKWSKTLSLQVSPPEKFELFQNYPNPFNPTTTISYQLPINSEVSIKVFDAVGREVATVFEGFEQAGYSEHQWVATNFASGMYIYQLTAKNEKGKSEFFRKKMLIVK